ncbi:carbohydrate oxidase from Microdochium Nivale in complex with substrate analogue [Xylariomycetidae sp. FL0641]|nr:carbohydrate oxidase from Microdochium Nivale in complex with substrate analogue [Xylariomycetidae sp. FL0641]
MHPTSWIAGSFAALLLVPGASAVTSAAINACLREAGVPVDTPGGNTTTTTTTPSPSDGWARTPSPSDGWARDAAPFNLRLAYAPAAIAVPTSVAHIQGAVRCGAALGVKVTAKAGGHSYASLGLGGEDGHLVVQLDRMYGVAFDAGTAVATVQAGARLGHLATVLYAEHGRAVSHGTCPGVGIAGHFLHGGFGFSSHTHGLAADAVVGATVVLANGTAVAASATRHADLFWGLRGAGSNFGIVASLELATFAAPAALTWFAGSLAWDSAAAAVAGLEALERYVKRDMPAALNFRVSGYSYGGAGAGIEGLYYGGADEADAVLAALMATEGLAGTITSSGTGTWMEAVEHYAYSEEVDQYLPSAQENFYAKSLTLKGLNGTAAADFVDYWYHEAAEVGAGGGDFTRVWWFQMDAHGGEASAVTRLANRDAAYAHRDKLYLVQFYDRTYGDAAYPPDGFALLDGWVAATTRSLAAADWGMYINYADPNLTRADANAFYYGENLARLRQIKAKYDPTELFFYPQSIEPLS